MSKIKPEYKVFRLLTIWTLTLSSGSVQNESNGRFFLMSPFDSSDVHSTPLIPTWASSQANEQRLSAIILKEITKRLSITLWGCLIFVLCFVVPSLLSFGLSPNHPMPGLYKVFCHKSIVWLRIDLSSQPTALCRHEMTLFCYFSKVRGNKIVSYCGFYSLCGCQTALGWDIYSTCCYFYSLHH
jgi:hypothetical protein